MVHRMIGVAVGVAAVLGAMAEPAAAAVPGASGVRVARVFSDHMVLQREMAVPIWGWAAPGAAVSVAFDGQTVEARADDAGRWRATLAPMKASDVGRELVIAAGDERVAIADVVVGEVWFAGGQSNMEYRAGQMAERLAEGRAMLEAADLPGVRFRRIDERDTPRPADDLSGGGWEVCTPRSAAKRSAVCFVFARRLHAELGVPVGVIDCSWGGTPIEPYIPASAFTGHPTLAKLGAFAAAGDVEAIKAMAGGTYVRSAAWLAGAIYNGRIAPVAPYAIRGAIWYQGESNSGKGEDPRDYAVKMRALIAGWGGAWGRADLPVYWVQLPQWNSYAWTYLRQEQLAALDVAHTGMAVTVDLDNGGDIHPPNKIDVGERLARWPLVKVYGKAMPVSGPIYRSMSVKDSAVTVTFDHADDGLMLARSASPGRIEPTPDATLNGFELADAAGAWHPAIARIEGSTVIVTADAVAAPVAVRYACAPQAPRGQPWNLYNRAGLPASPFCSDWSRMPYDPARNPR